MPSGRVNTAAITSVGTARESVMMAREAAKVTGFGVVLRAARNASGTLSSTDAVVPINAIQIVSNVASSTSRILSNRGGSMYVTRFHNSEKPPNNVLSVMLMYLHDHTVPPT